MTHPPSCPPWEYEDHPRKDAVFSSILPPILEDLSKGRVDAQTVAADSRPFHRRLFIQLTPSGYPYYAGHYRGEDFRCLRHCPVTIPSDPRVGASPDRALDEMRRFTDFILAGINGTDTADRLPRARLSEREKLRFLIAFVAQIFVDFLTIHPYLNGNGHIGRLLVWAILLRYGYIPQGWPVHPRPNEPEYSQLIARHRSGDKEPLEKALIRHVLLGSQ